MSQGAGATQPFSVCSLRGFSWYRRPKRHTMWLRTFQSMRDESSQIVFVRRALLTILVVGLVGAEIELLLLKHTDGFWQLVPVVAVAIAIAVVVWCVAAPSVPALTALRMVMVVFLIAGVVGVIQHFTGNIGYEKESNPGLAGAELYRAAAMGSTPLLAPGVMLQIGLVGLLFAFRHPALTKATR